MRAFKAVLFWVASFTWGLPMTLIGAVCAVVLMIAGYKPKRFHHFIYFEVGNDWGGFECGCFFIVNKKASLHIKQHEAGHGLQNIMLGWLMPFIVSIPSAIRYWYREYLYRNDRQKYNSLPPYDAIWFEGWASDLGRKYFKKEA